MAMHRPSRQSGFLWFLLLVYSLLAIWYAFSLPYGEGVDEAAHVDYAIFIKEHGRLPALTAAPNIDTVMAHHPPLYIVATWYYTPRHISCSLAR